MHENNTHRYDYFTISLLPGIGPLRGRELLKQFKTFSNLQRCSMKDLLRVPGFNTGMAEKIHFALREERRSGAMLRSTEHNANLAERFGIHFISFDDKAFPPPLRNIYDSPLFLFARGEMLSEDQHALAVVGTRNPSDYGRFTTDRFCRCCVEHEVTVVSGLALGIDTVAHRSTLQYGGRTLAVLGSGLRRIYPGINKNLAEQITEHGCVLSEFPLEAKPDAMNFPRRNRIISGLSQGLVVMESAKSGGAMISAAIALDQNKGIFAVPGSIHNAMSAGPHHLISKQGAQLARSPEHVLDELGLNSTTREKQPPPVQLTLLEQEIVQMLTSDPIHVDEIATETGRPLAALLPDLLTMEFRGIVRQLPGKYFQLESSNGN